jgi:sialate O-acetylesterase
VKRITGLKLVKDCYLEYSNEIEFLTTGISSMKKTSFIFATLFSVAAHAAVTLPALFTDNMVLQRQKPIIIWGWADNKEKITVQFNGQVKTTIAGKDKKWKVELDTEEAGGPYQLVVTGSNVIRLYNILVGEVWICSGQSNMEWAVKNSNDPEREIKDAVNPMIRHFKVPLEVSAQPRQDLSGGEWKICNPENAGDFTAVGYFFAQRLYRDLHVPIGLINTSWGGTHAETWTSRKAFEGSEEFKQMISTMPGLDLEALGKQRAAEARKRIESLQKSFSPRADEVAKWNTHEFNDKSWPAMKVPELWEQQQLGEFDGVVWLRKSFTLASGDAVGAATLRLAAIDDSDVTYVNGVKVGGLRNQYNEPRTYQVPAGILKEGSNVIAVRVEDRGGSGGIYGEGSDVNIRVASKTIDLAGEWKFQVESSSRGTAGVGPNDYPTLLFNAMINPLIPFSIRGALWYQGESNAGRAFQYRKAFPLMIQDWRAQWGQGDFPFYFVQLASFGANDGNSTVGSSWAELREAQNMTLSLPNTGMSITTDIGDHDDIHPRNKQDVGRRLSAIALANVYEKKVPFRGPSFNTMKVEENKIRITFNNVGRGLVARDKYGYVKGFEVAGADQKFFAAKASIDGNDVVVFQDGVTEPVAVRFGWADDASDNNLFNRDGFPAEPFRTDTWKGVTEKEKFSFSD